MQEEFLKQIAEKGAEKLFAVVWGVMSNAKSKIVTNIKVKKALRKYSENFIFRYGQVKVLGMPVPVPLLNIYTEVQIVSPFYINRIKSINELELEFRGGRSYDKIHGERKNGLQIANETKLLNVLGAPGSGKSTFLRKIGIETLVSNKLESAKTGNIYVHDSIPVLIELRRFKNEDVDIFEIIKNEFDIAGFPETEFFIKELLSQGKLLILLDGLDEVPSSVLDKVIEHIKDFKDKYHENRFITSCRTAFYKTYLNGFTDVEIANFNESQIKSFIRNWFTLDKDINADVANRLISLLFDRKNNATLELAQTPLLLTFLCLTFDETQRFPLNRSNLYKRALNILIERWAAEKRIHNEDIYQDFSTELEMEMLSEIAAKFFEQDQIFFYDDELRKEIKKFFEENLNVTIPSISKIVNAIEVQQGLLVQRAADIYSFSHLTVQEYLTANYFYSPIRINALIEKYLFDARWNEVFLLAAGMSNGDDLLRLISDYLGKYATNNPIIVDTIKWVNNILPNTDNYTDDVFKRVFLASLPIRFRRYPHGGWSTNDRLEGSADELLSRLDKLKYAGLKIRFHLTPQYAIKLLNMVEVWTDFKMDFIDNKNKIRMISPTQPLSKMLEGGRQKYRNRIKDELFRALATPDNIDSPYKKSYLPLVAYFDGCTRLLDCKESSIKISRETWRHICENLLNVA